MFGVAIYSLFFRDASIIFGFVVDGFIRRIVRLPAFNWLWDLLDYYYGRWLKDVYICKVVCWVFYMIDMYIFLGLEQRLRTLFLKIVIIVLDFCLYLHTLYLLIWIIFTHNYSIPYTIFLSGFISTNVGINIFKWDLDLIILMCLSPKRKQL